MREPAAKQTQYSLRQCEFLHLHLICVAPSLLVSLNACMRTMLNCTAVLNGGWLAEAFVPRAEHRTQPGLLLLKFKKCSALQSVSTRPVCGVP